MNMKMCVSARDCSKYCKLANFREYFIFANNVKTLICDVINSRQGRDLPIQCISKRQSDIADSRGFYFH